MAPEALPRGASVTEEAMSPREAARVLVEASRYEDAIRTRTEGITWMVWGIATPAIFLTYAFATVLGGAGWWMNALWLPWVGAAVLTTVLLWRSVALAVPAAREDHGAGFWLRLAGFTLGITGVFMWLRPEGPEIPLMVVGAMWSAMGLFDVWRSTRAGRLGAYLAGLPLLAAGALLALLDAPIEVSAVAGFLVSGLAPLATGAWLATRG